MPVAVVKIGIMRMRVEDRVVTMPMRMRLCHRPVVRVLMMRVMTVSVFVRERVMFMFMVVPFAEMHP